MDSVNMPTSAQSAQLNGASGQLFVGTDGLLNTDAKIFKNIVGKEIFGANYDVKGHALKKRSSTKNAESKSAPLMKKSAAPKKTSKPRNSSVKKTSKPKKNYSAKKTSKSRKNSSVKSTTTSRKNSAGKKPSKPSKQSTDKKSPRRSSKGKAKNDQHIIIPAKLVTDMLEMVFGDEMSEMSE